MALRDALLGVGIPFIEVHLSNVFRPRAVPPPFYLSDIAVGVVSGLGPQGYELALRAADRHLATTPVVTVMPTDIRKIKNSSSCSKPRASPKSKSRKARIRYGSAATRTAPRR